MIEYIQQEEDIFINGTRSFALKQETLYLSALIKLRMGISLDVLINCMLMKCGVLLTSGECILTIEENKKWTQNFMILKWQLLLTEISKQQAKEDILTQFEINLKEEKTLNLCLFTLLLKFPLFKLLYLSHLLLIFPF